MPTQTGSVGRFCCFLTLIDVQVQAVDVRVVSVVMCVG